MSQVSEHVSWQVWLKVRKSNPNSVSGTTATTRGSAQSISATSGRIGIFFGDGCPRGEQPAQIADRADQLIARLRVLDGNIAILSHGHFGRVLAARWIDLRVEHAQRFLLSTASLSILGYEHNCTAEPAIVSWNKVADTR